MQLWSVVCAGRDDQAVRKVLRGRVSSTTQACALQATPRYVPGSTRRSVQQVSQCQVCRTALLRTTTSPRRCIPHVQVPMPRRGNVTKVSRQCTCEVGNSLGA